MIIVKLLFEREFAEQIYAPERIYGVYVRALSATSPYAHINCSTSKSVSQ